GGGLVAPPPPHTRPRRAPARRGPRGAAGGLQATTRVFGQSFGTALVAIAFSVSAAHGPGLALVLGTICAALAVVVNTVRFSKLRAP
ncbi:hypothetical protein ACOTH9_23180, partial [Achromobacter xylosoxidans]